MQVAVQKPFEAHLPEARERLMQLLRHTAIRASKGDLEIMVRRTHKVSSDVSACLAHQNCLILESHVLQSTTSSGPMGGVQVTRVDFAHRHAMSYNELVNLIKNNILTSDWGDEDHIESILSEKCKWNAQMFKNVRWASCRSLGTSCLALTAFEQFPVELSFTLASTSALISHSALAGSRATWLGCVTLLSKRMMLRRRLSFWQNATSMRQVATSSYHSWISQEGAPILP